MRHSLYDAAASLGLSPSMVDETAKGAAKASPGLLVSFLTFVLQTPVEKWVSVAVLVFTVLQIAVLIRKEFFKRRRARGVRK